MAWIELQKQPIEYSLRLSKRARRLRLAIHADGRFVVTAPVRMNPRLIEPFIIRKSKWVLEKLEYFKKFPCPAFRLSTKKDFIEHKFAALALAEERVAHFNQIYCFPFNKISIKNQKTRWGSCSRRGNLSFNYKIILLPKHVADYIVVHELCHLGEFNHSPRFWNLVARVIPDHRMIRHQLKHGNVHLF
ncbi:M48 family peptidase [Candidatus Uhrbacteria bacterium]|nr:M48 family peptidase [Candidatus Uhrbacteria bacterium]